jgi:hypothetical protein
VVGERSDGEPAYKRGPVQPLRAWVTIHLSGLPGSIGRAVHFLLDLASGRVYQAAVIAHNAGALLPHRFTLTSNHLRTDDPRRFTFCCTSHTSLRAGSRQFPAL